MIQMAKISVKIASLILCLFLLSCGTGKKKLPNDFEKLTTIIDSIALVHQFNGVILINQNKDFIYKKAWGYSNLQTQKKLSTDDLFYIGSISKQVTAVMILQAYEKKQLLLTDKLVKYLPDIRQSWVKEITIHHLLTHTHGIVAIDQPLEFTPGSQFHYSQIGFGLLSQILEKINGRSFKEQSTELFANYGLQHTFHPENKVYSNLVIGYEENEKGEMELAEGNPVEYIAAGGFISNADDLAKWNTLLHSGELVNPETLNLMKTRYATREHPVFNQIEYGYGLLFKEGEEHKQIGAFGYVPGFPTANYYYPETGISLVILENTAQSLSDFTITFKVHTELMDLIKQWKEMD